MRNNKIDKGNKFDWGKTSKDYAKYRDIYPKEFYENIIDLGLCVKGQDVLDLGTGTGVLPRNMYPWGAKFIGADISENQIKEARNISSECNMDIEYTVSSAESIDFSPESFDVVTACQCHIYFDKNVVLDKIYDVLKPQGHFCILWMGWLPYEDKIAKMSENLILKYNPNWTGGNAVRPSIEEIEAIWDSDLFKIKEIKIYDLKVPFTRENWHGRMKACRGIGASELSSEEIAQFENEHLQMLNTMPETFDILHFVMMIDLQKNK